MKQRLATIATALTLVGAIFAGAPTAVRAAPGSVYVALSGVTYTGDHATECNNADYKTNGSDDDIEIGDAFAGVRVAGTVHICAGTYHFSDVVFIPNVVGIEGAGSTATILDGGNTTRLFTTESNVEIYNLTMQNARGNESNVGGAFLSYDSVFVENVIFAHNYADTAGGAIAAAGYVNVINVVFNGNTAADRGGAIASGGVVSALNSTFTNNRSIADAECVGGGGAIAAEDDVYVTNSTFRGNTAVLGAETDYSMCYKNESIVDKPFGGFGGAIATLGLPFILSSTFAGNTAVLGGGAIFLIDTAETGGHREINIDATSFAGNDLLPLPKDWTVQNFSRSGAAVLSFQERHTLTIHASSFTNNGHLGSGSDDFVVGTVVALDAQLTNSLFAGNRATLGGALYLGTGSVTDCTFTRNAASYWGGAMLTGGLVAIHSSKFIANRAPLGGALVLFGVATVEGSTFTANVARYVPGGQPFNGTRRYSGYGGAIMSVGETTLTSNRFIRNRAQGGGGAVFLNSNAGTTLALMTKNRFVGNSGGKFGGAVGYGLFNIRDEGKPTRAQLAKALRANRFIGNTAVQSPAVGGMRIRL
jgi:predicted outer membrane repeat protein